MRLIRHGCIELDGRMVFQNMVFNIPVENTDGRYETCAICKNPLYPQCTEKCGILRRDLKSDKEGLA